jgi:hypothetical protein
MRWWPLDLMLDVGQDPGQEEEGLSFVGQVLEEVTGSLTGSCCLVLLCEPCCLSARMVCSSVYP